MARIDYYAIEEAIQTLLKNDATLDGVAITVEEELIFGAESTPWVGIYLEGRSVPSDQQVLAAGTVARYTLDFRIWCWQYSLDKTQALKLRDDLLGKVEVTLMKNRTLGGMVASSWIEGGETPSGRLGNEQNSGWACGAEIILIAQAKKTTT